MRAEDRIRLQHMLDAARDAIGFAAGHKRPDLDGNRQLVLAIVKCVEIIGEAASQVSAEGRSQAPALPWKHMVSMRHRLVHAYYDIDSDVVWSTIQEDLPSLCEVIEGILAQG